MLLLCFFLLLSCCTFVQNNTHIKYWSQISKPVCNRQRKLNSQTCTFTKDGPLCSTLSDSKVCLLIEHLATQQQDFIHRVAIHLSFHSQRLSVTIKRLLTQQCFAVFLLRKCNLLFLFCCYLSKQLRNLCIKAARRMEKTEMETTVKFIHKIPTNQSPVHFLLNGNKDSKKKHLLLTGYGKFHAAIVVFYWCTFLFTDASNCRKNQKSISFLYWHRDFLSLNFAL